VATRRDGSSGGKIPEDSGHHGPDDEGEEAMPVFAFLPVQNLGFRFGLHSNWELVTSREAVRDNPWSRFLRDAAQEIILACFEFPQIQPHVLSKFLPRTMPGMNIFWTHFVAQIQNKTIEHLKKTSGMELRYVNSFDLMDRVGLTEDDLRTYGNISLISGSQLHGIRHEIKKLDVMDFIICLQRDWVPKTWSVFWELFSDEARNSNTELKSLREAILRAPVFLYGGSSERRKVPPNSLLFVKPNSDFPETPWRRDWVLLDYETPIEQTALGGKNGLFRVWRAPEIVEIIIALHSESVLKPETLCSPEEVFADLKFCMNNLPHVLAKYEKLEGQGGLLVPARTFAEKPKFPLLRETTLSKIFGIEFCDSPKPFENFPSENFCSQIKWEAFALALGCTLPVDPPPPSHVTVIGDFHELLAVREDFQTIIQHAEEKNLLEFVKRHLLVETTEGCLPCYKAYACSEVAGLLPYVMVPDELRESAKKLGLNLEVTTKTCIQCLLSLVEKKSARAGSYSFWLGRLSELIFRGSGDSGAVDVLFRDFPELAKQPLLKLSPVGDKHFFTLHEIIVPSEEILEDSRLTSALEIISENLGFAIISPAHNSNFAFLRDILLALKCKTNVTLSGFVKGLKILCRSKSSEFFIPCGVDEVTFVKQTAKSTWRSLYALVEFRLSKKFPELVLTLPKDSHVLSSLEGRIKNGIKFGALEKAREIFEILSYLPLMLENGKITSAGDTYACLSSAICATLSSSGLSSCLRIADREIVENCPILVSVCDIPYLEASSMVQFPRIPKNPERTLGGLQLEWARKMSGNPDLIVLTVKYFALEFFFIPNFRGDISEALGNCEDDSQYRTPLGDLSGCSWAVVDNYLLIPTGDRPPAQVTSSFLSGLATIRQLTDPGLNFLRAYVEISESWENRSEPSGLGGEEIKLRNKVRTPLRCCRFDQVHSQSTISLPLPKNLDLQLKLDKNFEHEAPDQVVEDPFDHFYRTALDRRELSCFSNPEELETLSKRFLELGKVDLRTLSRGPPPSSLEAPSEDLRGFMKTPIAMDLEHQKEVGRRGELFVFCFLKSLYGPNFEVTQWVSSIRTHYFPKISEKVADNAGYDFQVVDRFNHFVRTHVTGQTEWPTCFIEVKSCAGKFNNQFMISDNELRQMQNCSEKLGTYYILLFVEHVTDPRKTNIACLLNCHKSAHLLVKTPTEYSVRINWARSKKPRERKNEEVVKDPGSQGNDRQDQEHDQGQGQQAQSQAQGQQVEGEGQDPDQNQGNDHDQDQDKGQGRGQPQGRGRGQGRGQGQGQGRGQGQGQGQGRGRGKGKFQKRGQDHTQGRGQSHGQSQSRQGQSHGQSQSRGQGQTPNQNQDANPWRSRKK
jgi:hypothetical protein